MRMGEFFSWEEMTYSRRAVEKGLDNRYSRRAVENGLDNRPGAEARKALEHLVRNLLDPLRRLYGKPIAVTSGYRCEEVNRLVGGVPDSQHVKGRRQIVTCRMQASCWRFCVGRGWYSTRPFITGSGISCIFR